MIETIYAEVYGIAWSGEVIVNYLKSEICNFVIVVLKTKLLFVKIISNLKKIISKII
jgi:hypothetical protein